jgi:hypothetical protein
MDYLVMGIALCIAIVIGVVIGIFIGTDRMRKAIQARTLGRLRIDHSEPDEPTRMFTELKGVTPDMIAQDKFVIFEVINESYISHN